MKMTAAAGIIRMFGTFPKKPYKHKLKNCKELMEIKETH